MPTHFNEHARDWSETAVTRLLAEPLFVEKPSRGIASHLIQSLQRISASHWRLTLNPKIRWSNGDVLMAEQVCQQFVRARAAAAASATVVAMIKSLKLISQRVIEIETRVPIAHLHRVLMNPGLGPRHTLASVTVGPYLLDKISAECIHLTSVAGGRPVELVPCDFDGASDAFDRSEVNISGPMSTASRNWEAISCASTSTLGHLDIAYVLLLPRWLSPELGRMLRARIDRRRICSVTNGAVVGCHRLSDVWGAFTVKPGNSHLRDKPPKISNDVVRLLHTRFPPNPQLAQSLAAVLSDDFGLTVDVAECDYHEFTFHGGKPDDDAFRLALVSSPWPHPVAMLSPFFLGAGSTTSFKAAFMAAIDESDLVAAERFARIAESVLEDHSSTFLTLGWVMGCIRSDVGKLWCPPSGWIDYSQLAAPLIAQ